MVSTVGILYFSKRESHYRGVSPLYIIRFLSSWVEFTTGFLLIFTMLRILDRSVVFKIIMLSFIMAAVSFTLKVVIPVGYVSFPAVVLTSILLLMVLFHFSSWLAILLGIINALISGFLEMLFALPLVAFDVIDLNVRNLLIDSVMLVPVSVLNLALAWLMNKWKWGLYLPDQYMYGKKHFFRQKYIISTVVTLFMGVSLSTYSFGAQYGLGYSLSIIAMYISIAAILKITYQSNKNIITERYGKPRKIDDPNQRAAR
jgi:hypothetical protein